MAKTTIVLVLLAQIVYGDRVYESECPAVDSLSDFDMEKFLGVWYQVQPDDNDEQREDSDQSEPEIPSCEFYNLTHSKHLHKYVVNTNFELYPHLEGTKQFKYETISTNYLTVFDEYDPAKMRFISTYPAAYPVIESNFTVLMTDYDTYAIISNCDKELNEIDEFQFTQHMTIWSRSRDLQDNFVDKLYENVGAIDFDPYDLNNISRTGCLADITKLISINLDNGQLLP